MSIDDDARAFKPGLYRHYRGGFYTAICLVTHHEHRQPMVLYVSHTYGGTNVRPLRGWLGDEDGWLDEIVADRSPEQSSQIIVQIGRQPAIVRRFTYVGELPSDELIVDRIRP